MRQIAHQDLASFIGNAAATAFFSSTLASSPAHAYLLIGPDQVGKRTLARALAATLLRTERPEVHGDFLEVRRQLHEKTGKLQASVTVDQVREATRKLALSSFGDGKKIAVIDGVDGMAAEAANALLKTLEEPRGDAHLFLLAESAAAVLPTIRSRCQLVLLQPVSGADIAVGLGRRGLPQEQAMRLARLANGRPGRAVALAADPRATLVAERLTEMIFSFPTLPVADRWTALDGVIPPKTSFNEAGDRARAFLGTCSAILADAFAGATGAATPHDPRAAEWSRLGPARLAAVIEEVGRCTSLLDDNVAPRSALEHFVSIF